ncbi:hypothetical protein ABTY98_27980 [Streptomyces sp. NPDC096040]|uniref:hypothetical protein n=1 Tax=Streptomyces sp. NPDC096040 TaxID=3155541 RepID=UPI00332E42EC
MASGVGSVARASHIVVTTRASHISTEACSLPATRTLATPTANSGTRLPPHWVPTVTVPRVRPAGRVASVVRSEISSMRWRMV